MSFNTDYAVLITVAALIGGFSILVLVLRIGIELSLWDKDQVTWIPLADWLLVVSTVLSFFGVLIPSVLASTKFSVLLSVRTGTNLPIAACIAACILAGAYIPAILAHYAPIRVPGVSAKQESSNDEAVSPGAPDQATDLEKVIVEIGFGAALIVFIILFLG
jgi:hypothetical protein